MNLNLEQHELKLTDLEKFVISNSERKHRPSTTELYRRVFKKLFATLGNKYLDAICKEDIENYINVGREIISNVTLNIEIRTIKAIFNLAIYEEFYFKNPAKKIKQLPILKKTWQFITQEEFKTLISRIDDSNYKTLIQTAYYTGMRLSEIIHLQWNDIDLNKQIIHITNKVNFLTKTGECRDIPISNILLEILVAHKDKRYDGNVFGLNDYVFPNKKHNHFSKHYISRRFKKYVRKAGLDENYHFHSLRHSCISELFRRGADIYSLKELAGHSNIKTTERYLHNDFSSLRKVMNG